MNTYKCKCLAFIKSRNGKICIAVGVAAIILAAVLVFRHIQSHKSDTEYVPVGIEGFDSDNDSPANSAKSSKTLALFYAPWCGHCKTVMPIWDRLDETHRSSGLGEITIIKVNCDEQKDVAKQHGVSGFPTIKLLPQGLNVPDQAVEYQGDRSYDSLIDFMKSN
jgi:protein disulfide-isomerase-like protein